MTGSTRAAPCLDDFSDREVLAFRSQFGADVLAFLTGCAGRGILVTYGALAQVFGRGPRSWGAPLTKLAEDCHARAMPLFPVLVVAKATGLPSTGAGVYRRLGLTTETAVRDEQMRCFDFARHTRRSITPAAQIKEPT